RPNKNRVSPEFRQHLALNLDVLQPRRIRGNLDCRDHFRQTQAHVITRRGIEMHLLHFAIQISRRHIELLAFPLVHVCPNGVPICPMKFRVHIHQRLHSTPTTTTPPSLPSRAAGPPPPPHPPPPRR